MLRLHIGLIGLSRTRPANLSQAAADRRAFRTVLILAVVTTLNVFDLALTQSQFERGNFHELNGFAARAMEAHGPAGLAAFKLLLFGSGAAILYICRRRRESEAGAWVLLGCHTALVAWWLMYLGNVEVCLSDPAVTAPRLLF